jgi:hypothetical protein
MNARPSVIASRVDSEMINNTPKVLPSDATAGNDPVPELSVVHPDDEEQGGLPARLEKGGQGRPDHAAELTDLAAEIREEREKYRDSMRRTFKRGIKVGELLVRAQERVKHCSWQAWVEARCGFSTRTASGYMRAMVTDGENLPDVAEWQTMRADAGRVRFGYYPVQKNWGRKFAPHLDNPYLNKVLRRDFGRYLWGQWKMKFAEGTYPFDYEAFDNESPGWWLGHRGRTPEFWRYVKYGACYWLVNFNYHLARLAEPCRPWRIVASGRHATVWDRDRTLFDMNAIAIGVPASDCYRDAFQGGEELGEAEELQCGYPLGWADEA